MRFSLRAAYIRKFLDGNVDFFREIDSNSYSFGKYHGFLFITVDLKQIASHLSDFCLIQNSNKSFNNQYSMIEYLD